MSIEIQSRDDAEIQQQWRSCDSCKDILFAPRFDRLLQVCPACGFHHRVRALDRIGQLIDPGTAKEIPAVPDDDDPLDFTDLVPYGERLSAARARTGVASAIICVEGEIEGCAVVAAVMDFAFMGGSMGTAVGERFCVAAERALRTGRPLLVVSTSGGARMQEGTLALMQMARTAQAVADLDRAGILTVSLIADPTFGGVAASFATLADVIVAEPGARMGFAGPRVIEQTIKRTLPPGFQTAEFLADRGLVDLVVPRSALRSTLSDLFRGDAENRRAPAGPEETAEVEMTRRPEDLPERRAWEVVEMARAASRPTTLDYAAVALDSFRELKGDRLSGDCPAVIGGLGRLAGRRIVLIGHQKGHETLELVRNNFGMPLPSGYRKAVRLMKLAGKLGCPVVTLIDTPGAYPGPEAEEHGQAFAISESLRVLATLPVPVVAVITGEGGSGGALAFGLADRVLALSNSVYSVISPEGCAAILWRDASKASTAAEALRLDARNQLALGVVDEVILEPAEGAHAAPIATVGRVRRSLVTVLDQLDGTDPDDLVRRRHDRFRRFGARSA